jgi:hypothetical protein
MFKHIVTQISGRLMALSTQALALLKELLLKLVSYLLASCILVFLSVAKLYNLVVQIVLSIKAWLVSLTTVVQSIKAALTNAKAKAILLGQQLLTIARRIKQLVHIALSPKKDKPVASTKLARSRSKGSKTAQTRTAPQSTQAGLKSAAVAKQLRQHVKAASKKGK